MDIAHKKTDSIINLVDRENKSIYTTSYKAIRDKFYTEYAKIQLNANMSAQEKLEEAGKYERLGKIADMVAEDIVESNKTAISNINKSFANIYEINYNQFTDGFGIDTYTKRESKEEVNDNKDPYNEIAIDSRLDKQDIKKKVSSSLIASILKVESPIMAMSALKSIYESNLSSSNTINETQATRIENLARETAMNEGNSRAEKEGYVILKVWNTVGDTKVRDAHARAEGQEAELDKPFYVGGERLMFPGDINASPANRINCRCYLTYRKVKK